MAGSWSLCPALTQVKGSKKFTQILSINSQRQADSNYSQMFTECSGQFLDAMLEHRPTFLHVAPPLVTPIRCLHKKRPYLDYQMLLDDHDDHAKANVKLTTKNLFHIHHSHFYIVAGWFPGHSLWCDQGSLVLTQVIYHLTWCLLTENGEKLLIINFTWL